MGADTLSMLLAMGRARAESRMRSTARARRPIGETTDPVTGAATTTYAVSDVYNGKCRVKDNREARANTSGPSTSLVVESPEVHVPWAAAAFETGDHIEILTAENPRLVGRVFRVSGLHEGDDTTACRLPVERLP